ncbi:hypothetical protein [Kitasatospora sp. NBC_00458]|uniref:hypothetical protein n=1 Tax=Kitasatospora sp. NBC_00458 TaxID=2903568 RepID=UPI002E17CB56
MPALLPHVPRLPGPFVPAEPSVTTPLGVLVLRAELGGRPVPSRPTRLHRLPAGGLLYRWERADADLELLLCPLRTPASEVSLAVDNGWGAVWGLDARTALDRVRLTASFQAVPADVYSGYAGGQSLAAVELSDPGTVLHLGGSDEEEICARARSGSGVPRAWAARLDEVYARGRRPAWGVEYLDEHQGLRWTLPPLAAGDHVRLHAAVGWRTPRPDDPEDDESTWWAVLTDPERILAAAEGDTAA